jgi:hypothetical protein
LSADFGIYRTSGDAYTLGNLVWDDLDGDGFKDPTEDGIADVTIDLYLDEDTIGVFDPSEPFIGQVTTDANGAYTFYGLVDDDYFVVVSDDNNILDGWTWTDGEDDTDNHSQVTPYPAQVSGGNFVMADFGYDLNPTWVTVSSFEAYEKRGQVVVEWQTSAESGTAGFILSRKTKDGEFIPLHDGMLPGLIHSPQGGTYRFLDEDAEPGGTYTYALQEVESSGVEQQHGPFTVEVNQVKRGKPSVSPRSPYWKGAHELNTPVSNVGGMQGGGAQEVTPPAAPGGFFVFFPTVTKQRSPEELPDGKPAKVTISQDGLYYLSAEDIASAMNISTGDAQVLIHDRGIQLLHEGEQVAYLPQEGEEGIYFYGEAIDSIFSSENVYWLIQGSGETMTSVTAEGPEPLVEEEEFIQVLHFEEDNMALTGLFDDPLDDYWLWLMFTASNPGHARSFAFNTPGATANGSATINVYLQGATDVEADPPDHHVIVNMIVDDVHHKIGEGWWDGASAQTIPATFQGDLLKDGENTLEVIAVLDDGVPYSIVYIDSFTVTYDRNLRAVDESLTFPGGDLPVITVRDFTNSEIFVFDITDPKTPVQVTATTVSDLGGTYSVSFAPDPGEKEYLAVSMDGLSTADSIAEDDASDLKSGSNAATYLVITVDELMASAQPLMTYRQGQGMSTMAVDVVDIYDEFNYGIAKPEAIKDFLSFAVNNWSTPPSFVVLFGTGTYDYKDNLGFGDNLVPASLVRAFNGLFASDTYYADIFYDDGVPDLIIGRLPVGNPGEAATAIAKITGYEAINTNPWTQNVIMMADDTDENAGDFPADSDDLAAIIPLGYNINKVYLAEGGSNLTEARAQLLNGINAGAGFVNYMGHAGLDRLAYEGLLLSGDVATLSNAPMFPIMTAITCVAGRFEIPGHTVIGEAMFLDSDGGAISVWAPSGLSFNDEAKVFEGHLVQAIFNQGATTLGEAILAASQAYASGAHARDMLEIYNLLGDPALVIGWNQGN